MQEAIFRHKVPVQVRFADLDVLGHVTNAVYQVYYNCGGVSYFQNVFADKDLVTENNIVMASTTIDYFKPIFLHSKIVVEIRVSAMGRKSFDFETRIVDEESGEVYSRAKAIQVCFSRTSQQPIVMPARWRENVLAYEPTPPLQR